MENKVAKKAIITIDLLKLIPLNQIVGLDVKQFLFKELILKEKEFKQQLKEFDFSQFENKLIYLHCSNHAIVPMWAYMMISSYLTKQNIKHLFADNYNLAVENFIIEAIDNVDVSPYLGKRIVIKGCGGKIKLSPNCYTKITQLLVNKTKAISYGEACSMVAVSKN